MKCSASSISAPGSKSTTPNSTAVAKNVLSSKSSGNSIAATSPPNHSWHHDHKASTCESDAGPAHSYSDTMDFTEQLDRPRRTRISPVIEIIEPPQPDVWI